MRAAIVTHRVIRGDGQGRSALEIARRALREGFALDLYATQVDQDLIDAGARHIEIPHTKIGNAIALVNVIEFAVGVDRRIERQRAEYSIIHGHGYSLTRPHHVNNSQFCHDAWRSAQSKIPGRKLGINEIYQSVYTRFNIHSEKASYDQAKAIVPASSLVRSELSTIGYADKINTVISNGADLDIFYPGREDRAALGLPREGLLALFAGDIKLYRKNLDSVLKAFVEVPDVQLVVVGRLAGSPFPALAASLGLADRVHFLDFRRDIAAIMRACDFFVFPSRYEACALVLIESLCSGLPIVTSKSTGGSEFVQDAALVIDDPNDVAALGEAVRRLAGDAELRARLREKALQIRPQFSWDRITDKWMAVWEENKGGVG